MTSQRPTILLMEPQFVLRRTVASVAHQLGLADVHEASSLSAAADLLATRRFDAALVDLDPAGRAVRWLGELSAAGRQLHLIVMLQPQSLVPLSELEHMSVHVCLHKPLKVRELIASIRSLPGCREVV